MARTLKSTGIAADAIAVIAVDDDGTTVKDFVSGNTFTVDPNVTVGTDTWNGTTQPYFETKSGVDTFNFYGITYSGTLPTLTFGTELSLFMAINAYIADRNWLASNSGRTYGAQLTASNQVAAYVASGQRLNGNTVWSTANKFSAGWIWRKTGTCEAWYGEEDGLIAQDGTAPGNNFGGDVDLTSIGGAAGGGYINARFHVFAWFNRAPTSTEWANLHSDPFGTLFESGGASVAVGQAAETDSALAVTRSKARAVGLATETDAALPISTGRAKAIGQASEADTAQAVAHSKARAIGQAAEADTAQPITVRRTYAVGTASESDAALPIGHAKAKAIGIATEADEALPVTSGNSAVLGQAIETDTALAVGRSKVKAIGFATESNTALAVRPAKVRTVGAASESDLAFAAGIVKRLTVGQAIETDAAIAVAAAKRRTLGIATETDTALSILASGPAVFIPGAPVIAARARPTVISARNRPTTIAPGRR